ncbi:MAG TPA: lipid-A-disaccharide synthase [Acidiferrobacterales bacterium]
MTRPAPTLPADRPGPDGASAAQRGLRIGMIAGEVSGDLLGGRLLRALRERVPGLRVEGVGGAEMAAEGCRSLVPLERLSVMGLTEILGRYRELRRIRARLIRHFLDDPPDVFVGVDFPGFNLGVERALKRAGIPTVHYVSPQVWAWRRWRVRTIRKSVDLMLALFPFEEAFYARHRVPVRFVGHPLADEIDGEIDVRALRQRLKLPQESLVLAMLPGSRVTELKAHADLFVQTALWLTSRDERLHFVVPFVNRQTRVIFEEAVKRNAAWDLPLTRMHGHSRDAMAAADAVLVASGTATLEAMLLKRPMVVTYRVSFLSARLIKWLSSVKLYSMPNNLAGRALVPELLQGRARPVALGQAVLDLIGHPEAVAATLEEFDRIHASLRRGASAGAAAAILELVAQRRPGDG